MIAAYGAQDGNQLQCKSSLSTMNGQKVTHMIRVKRLSRILAVLGFAVLGCTSSGEGGTEGDSNPGTGGAGAGDSGTGGAGAGDSGTGGAGGGANPCADKSCGDPCLFCPS